MGKTMNEVELVYEDKKDRTFALRVNGIQKGGGMIHRQCGFNAKKWYTIRLANEFNPSSPIDFESRTLQGLIGQLNRHPYKLVR